MLFLMGLLFIFISLSFPTLVMPMHVPTLCNFLNLAEFLAFESPRICYHSQQLHMYYISQLLCTKYSGFENMVPFPIGVQPKSFKHLFSTSNFTSTLLNCLVLEHSDFKTKQLRSALVKL